MKKMMYAVLFALSFGCVSCVIDWSDIEKAAEEREKNAEEIEIGVPGHTYMGESNGVYLTFTFNQDKKQCYFLYEGKERFDTDDCYYSMRDNKVLIYAGESRDWWTTDFYNGQKIYEFTYDKYDKELTGKLDEDHDITLGRIL